MSNKYSKKKSRVNFMLKLVWMAVGLLMVALLVQGFFLLNRVSYYFP